MFNNSKTSYLVFFLLLQLSNISFASDTTEYKFKKSATTCFMDYYNEPKDFYKWQWDILYSEAKKYYSI